MGEAHSRRNRHSFWSEFVSNEGGEGKEFSQGFGW